MSILAASAMLFGLATVSLVRAQSTTPELEVDFTNSYSPVWNDAGSGANLNVSFWRPEPAAGWFRVGDHIKQGYGRPTESTIVVRETISSALARPLDYMAIWNDAGSGASQDGSVWRPVCPNGYGALGDVTNGSHAKPSIDAVRCVRQSALAAALPGNLIWDDTGSGATVDFGAWGLQAPAPDSNFTYQSRGLFYGAPSHSRPTIASAGVWVVRINRSSNASANLPNSSGTSVEDQLWDTVKNSQRVQDFQDYLRTYPNGQYAAIANIKIRQLTPTTSPPPVSNSSAVEDQFWDTVKNSQRIQDFQDYLRTYPNGQYASIANIKIRQLSSNTSAPPVTNTSSWEDRDWARIQNSQRAQDFQDFLRDYPNSRYASIANIKIRQLGGNTSAPPVTNTTSSVEQQYWDAVEKSQRWQDFQGYLDNYPNGKYAPIARLKISQLGGSAGPATQPTNPGTSRNAAFLNQLASTNKAKLPMTVGDIQLFDSFSVCQSGCQQMGNTESVVIRARTPNLSNQRVTIGQVEQSLKSAMVKGYCGSPEHANNVTLDIDVDDMFNQKIGHFFITSRDCGGNAGTTVNPPTTVARPSATGFQQVIAAAQPGSISEIARARKFFVVSNDFSIKSKIAAAITKALPQMQVASTEQDADFLIGFELTDRTTGLVTPNDDKNANLRGEMIVFTMIPATAGRAESIRILFRVTKERGFGVFSATPDENAAKEFAKQLAKVII